MIVTVVPTEHQEQVSLIQWLKIKGLSFTASPNGGLRNKIVAAKLKAEGVSAGFPDLTIFLPEKVLFIEMKRQKGGTVRQNQKEWLKYLDSLPYVSATVCNGWREAVEFIEGEL